MNQVYLIVDLFGKLLINYYGYVSLIVLKKFKYSRFLEAFQFKSMKKLFLLILSSLPFQIFADNNMISHVEDICMQNEGFYEISQEEPLRNKQVRILS